MCMSNLNRRACDQPSQPHAAQERRREAVKDDFFGEKGGHRGGKCSRNMHFVPKGGLSVGKVDAVPFRSRYPGREKQMQDSLLACCFPAAGG
ncbi:hypothetical protein GCM10010520_18180 [Rhizobium viscosum]